MTERDDPDAAADRLDALAAAEPERTDAPTITTSDVDSVGCRWCRDEFAGAAEFADHFCEGLRDAQFEAAVDDDGQLEPQTHELGANLLFAAHGLDPYFGVVSQFDRCLQNGEAGDDVGPFEAAGEEWALNHDEEKVKYHQGAIATRPQDSGEAYYEYNVGVVATDEVGRKRINFQFRPALPNATHAETGERIESLPEDLPEGLRVQVDAANVALEDVIPVLRGLFEAMGVSPDYIVPGQAHEWSRVYNLAVYARILRAISEQRIVDRGGLLDRLSSFAASRRGRGEYTWDNEEIVGHRTTVALNQTNLGQFYDGHTAGKLLKSYHMKNPEENADPDQATSHPKLEVQFSTEYSGEVKSVPWHADEATDAFDLRAELTEWLLNALHWAGLPTSPDETVYVADQYWDVDARDDELPVRADPMPALEEQRRDLAEYHVLREDLSPGERSVLKALADGGEGHYEDVADAADASTSTVYRAAEKLSDVVDRAHGELRLTDEVVADRVDELFSSLEDTAAWIEGQVSALAREHEYLSEDSTFAKWMRSHGVGIEERRGQVDLELHGGRYTRDEVQRVLRAGYDAARQAGPNLGDTLLDASVTWTAPDGERVGPRQAFTIQSRSTIFALGNTTARDVG
jgi:hypothetical protein